MTGEETPFRFDNINKDHKCISMFTGRPLVHSAPTLIQSQRRGAGACAPPCFGHVT